MKCCNSLFVQIVGDIYVMLQFFTFAEGGLFLIDVKTEFGAVVLMIW